MSKKSHAAGWASDAPTPAQLKEFFAQIESGRITQHRLQEFLRGSSAEFPVSLDYSQSLADMVAAGHYDQVNSDITADHFPISGTGTVERTLFLIQFNRFMSSEAALKELKAQGLRPATIEELLAFGKIYPNKQLEFSIICLGSVWTGPRDGRFVPCLGRDGSWRALDVRYSGDSLAAGYRFLAVRE